MAFESPAVLASEVITYTTFLLCARHAWRNGIEHQILLVVTLFAASAVDPFCLISEQIRNYYHDHASILMADRHVAPWQFPLFCNLAYLGTASVWKLNLPLKVETAAVAVVNSYTFYPADQFFCSFLVYQWHQTDPLYFDRNGAGSHACVPCGSSMWVMTYGMCGSLLARLSTKWYKYTYKTNLRSVFSMEGLKILGTLILIFLPLHIVPVFPLLYAPIAMLYGDAALAVRVFFWGCTGFCVYNFKAEKQSKGNEVMLESRDGAPNDKCVLTLACLIWFGGFAVSGYILDPSNIVSLSVHQPYGGSRKNASNFCDDEEVYLFGLGRRKKYICDEDFKFWSMCDDKPRPNPGDQTYHICGVEGDEPFWREYFGSIAIGCCLHTLCFIYAARKNAVIKDD